VKFKYPLVLAYLLLLLLPFIFLRDIFPFMRMGMFAMPYRNEANKEAFKVTFGSRHNPDSIWELSEKDLKLNKAHWHYLMRNHHYRNEQLRLMQSIAPLLTDSVQLIRFHRSTDTADQVLLTLNRPFK
jgi:hypothetical protein